MNASNILHAAENVTSSVKDKVGSIVSDRKQAVTVRPLRTVGAKVKRNSRLSPFLQSQAHVEKVELTGDSYPGLYVALAIQGTTTRFPSSILTDKSAIDLSATLHVNANDVICVELWSTSSTLGGTDVFFGKCCFPISSLPTDNSSDSMYTGVSLKSGEGVTATMFGIGGGLGGVIVKSQMPSNLAATVVVRMHFAGTSVPSTTTPTRNDSAIRKDAAAPETAPELSGPLRVRAPAIVSPSTTPALQSTDVPQQPRSS